MARVTVELDVVYGTAGRGGRDLRCNVYQPPPDTPGFPSLRAGRRVGVLLVHGGGWMMGDRMMMDYVGKFLGRAGYVCVSNEYRLAAEAPWPAMIHDCKACVRWMRANGDRLGIDPDCICVQGNSAGGHLALMLAGCDGDLYPELEGQSGNGSFSSRVSACVPVYPVTSMSRPSDSDELAKVIELIFDSNVTDRDFELFSPITYARRTFPPTCFIHGNGDNLVSTKEVMKMYQELHDRGAHVELHLYACAPHGFDGDFKMFRSLTQLSILFLDRFFRPEGFAYPIDLKKEAGNIEMGGVGADATAIREEEFAKVMDKVKKRREAASKL